MNQLKYFQSLGLNSYSQVNNYLISDLQAKEAKNSKNIFIYLKNINLDKRSFWELRSDSLTGAERDFIRRNDYDSALYSAIKGKVGRESRNSIKTSIIEKYNCSKEDVEIITDFISQVNKDNKESKENKDAVLNGKIK